MQAYVDAHEQAFIDRLAAAVAIPSVSGDAKHRQDVFAMADWLQKEMESLEVKVKRVELGKHIMDGQELPLPPVLFGQYGEDPAKKTILLYGHMVRKLHPPYSLRLSSGLALHVGCATRGP